MVLSQKPTVRVLPSSCLSTEKTLMVTPLTVVKIAEAVKIAETTTTAGVATIAEI